MAEILASVMDGMDREPGGEQNYLACLQAATTADAARDALRILGEFPYSNEAERLVRREKALKAAKACPAELSAPASLLNEFLPLKPAPRETTRPSTRHGLGLEDPELWPEKVSGAELLAELEVRFSRRVVLPNGGAAALALWTLLTYCFDAFDTCPLLVLASPEKQCGKTTALTLLAHLCRRAVQTSNVTPAALFRLIEEFHPTVAFDEADAAFDRRQSGGKREELRSVLDSGHTRSMAVVWRCDGDSHNPRAFSTWAPKVVALIGRAPSTVEDRSIIVPMRRMLPGQEVERFRIGRLDDELLPLRRMALRWANDHQQALERLDPALPPGLGNREADNWRPLLAISDCAGGDWPTKAREAIEQLRASQPVDESGSLGALLLADIREVFEQAGQDKLFTEKILRDLAAREDRPWGDWRSTGRAITAQTLAGLLKPYGIRPRDIRIGADNKKGYHRSRFEDAWARYAPVPPSATPRQTPPAEDSSAP